MISRNPRLSLVVISALLVVILAASPASYPIRAQGGTSESLGCDPIFGSDALQVFDDVNNQIAGSLDSAKIGDLVISLSQIRQEYVDFATPPECEAVRHQVIKIADIIEDKIFVMLAGKLDAKNQAIYTDLWSKTGKPRMDSLEQQMNTTTAASMPAATPTAQLQECKDSPYKTNLIADLGDLTPPTGTDLGPFGMFGLKVIKLRYKYEDLTPPVGCETLQFELLETLSLSEDQTFLGLIKAADNTPVAATDEFITNTLTPRLESFKSSLWTDIGIASGAATQVASATATPTR
jgi:hypothetical protein